MEADASRYHGKAPDEIDWSLPERQTRAVAEFLAALDDEDPNANRKLPKVISPVDPCSAWTAKANKRVQFGYGLNYLIDIENAVIVDVEATPARSYDEVAATKTMIKRTEADGAARDEANAICPRKRPFVMTITSSRQSPRYGLSRVRCLMERAELVARALDFLVRLTDEDVPLDEALNALSALAEQFQSGAIVGGTLIDSSSATFERVVYPSMPASPFSTLRHVPISSPIFGTCAKAVREGKIISCSDTATEACFDVSWRSLYLGLGIHSVQSAPVFSFNGKALGTFVVALREPHASFDMEMTGFGVYGMRTILQKPSCYHYRPRDVP